MNIETPWYDRLFRFLFPYRYMLLEELDYLRTQLSQKQRRIDELQEALIEVAKPAPRLPRSKPEILPPLKNPRGWEAYRQNKRENPDPEPELESVIDSEA